MFNIENVLSEVNAKVGNTNVMDLHYRPAASSIAVHELFFNNHSTISIGDEAIRVIVIHLPSDSVNLVNETLDAHFPEHEYVDSGSEYKIDSPIHNDPTAEDISNSHNVSLGYNSEYGYVIIFNEYEKGE